MQKRQIWLITLYFSMASVAAAADSVPSDPSCDWDFSQATSTFRSRALFIDQSKASRDQDRVVLARRLEAAGKKCLALAGKKKDPKLAAEYAARGWSIRIDRLNLLGDPDKQLPATILEAIHSIENLDGDRSRSLLPFLLKRSLDLAADDPHEAEQRLEQALDIAREHFGHRSGEVARVLTNKAFIAERDGKGAESYYRQAAKIFDEAPELHASEDHYDFLVLWTEFLRSNDRAQEAGAYDEVLNPMVQERIEEGMKELKDRLATEEDMR